MEHSYRPADAAQGGPTVEDMQASRLEILRKIDRAEEEADESAHQAEAYIQSAKVLEVRATDLEFQAKSKREAGKNAEADKLMRQAEEIRGLAAENQKKGEERRRQERERRVEAEQQIAYAEQLKKQIQARKMSWLFD